jgi:acyl-CoA carboxylase subunit beta
MEVLESRYQLHDERAQHFTAVNRQLSQEMRDLLAKIRQGGGEQYQARQREQGKLFVRERIDKLMQARLF